MVATLINQVSIPSADRLLDALRPRWRGLKRRSESKGC
jgi:hypothetical protein